MSRRAGLRPAPGLPLGPARAVRRAGARASRRHRRPVRRHAGRPDARRSSSERWPAAADAPGYPPTVGHPGDPGRPAWTGWRGASASSASTTDAVLPTIGSKELVAVAADASSVSAPATCVVHPSSPTRPTTSARGWPAPRRVATDVDSPPLGPRRARAGLAQLPVQPDRPGAAAPSICARSSPGPRARTPCSSPTSATSSSAGTPQPVSVLHPDVCGGSLEGILAVHSLSKRSNLAGYRGGFVAGDPRRRRRAARGAQARRPDGARAGPERAMVAALERRRARRRAARALRRPAAPPCARRWRRPASASTTPRQASTCGPPATSRAGTP